HARIPIVSARASPNTCPFPRFRSLEVFRRRPLAVWDVCDGRHLKTFTQADDCTRFLDRPIYLLTPITCRLFIPFPQSSVDYELPSSAGEPPVRPGRADADATGICCGSLSWFF